MYVIICLSYNLVALLDTAMFFFIIPNLRDFWVDQGTCINVLRLKLIPGSTEKNVTFISKELIFL